MQVCPCNAPGGKVYVPLLGENLLPEALNSQRRSMRRSVRDLRDPVRNFRESNIPGPDIVGQLENRIMDARDSFVSRDMVMSRLQDLRGNGFDIGPGNIGPGSNGDSSNGNGNNNSGGSSNGEQSRRSAANNPTVQ